MNYEERRKYLGLRKAPEDKRDYIFRVTRRLYLPNKVDYTSEMSPVEDQGEEGACCGFASDAMKQWQEKRD